MSKPLLKSIDTDNEAFISKHFNPNFNQLTSLNSFNTNLRRRTTSDFKINSLESSGNITNYEDLSEDDYIIKLMRSTITGGLRKFKLIVGNN